jgi:hypothetical protein
MLFFTIFSDPKFSIRAVFYLMLVPSYAGFTCVVQGDIMAGLLTSSVSFMKEIDLLHGVHFKATSYLEAS